MRDESIFDKVATMLLVGFAVMVGVTVILTLMKWILEFASTTLGAIIIIIVVLRILKWKENELK